MIILCLLSTISLFAFAGEREDSVDALVSELRKIDSIEKSFHYKTGKVVLKDGIGTINILPGYKFLEGKEALYIIQEIWGNLKEEEPLGMIVPANSGAVLADYAFIVNFQNIGYVKDGDAKDINYEDLLKQMKEENKESNKERSAQGVSTLELIGWANKPYYDEQKKILHWAKEYRVPGEENNTLNYDVRVLGRNGVLVLQAVAGMDQMDTVNKNLGNIIGMCSFNEGHRYSDFDSKTDDIAAWTIGGLVAGKVLAKAGFFAIILKNIKLLFLGLAAAGGGIWRFIKGRRKRREDELAYQTAPPEETPVV